jgi:hypothetical protein
VMMPRKRGQFNAVWTTRTGSLISASQHWYTLIVADAGESLSQEPGFAIT